MNNHLIENIICMANRFLEGKYPSPDLDGEGFNFESLMLTN